MRRAQADSASNKKAKRDKDEEPKAKRTKQTETSEEASLEVEEGGDGVGSGMASLFWLFGETLLPYARVTAQGLPPDPWDLCCF